MVIRRWAFHSQGPLFVLFFLLCSHAGAAAEKPAEPETTMAPATVRQKPPAAPTPLLLRQLTLPQALALARKEHKGLLVEVGASWCQPCKFLEQFIFPHPRSAHGGGLRALRCRSGSRRSRSPEQRRFIAGVIARFPRSERADKALRLLMRLGPGDESAVKALSAYIGEHNQDGDAAELTTAVYASLQVGACEPAQKAARQLAVLTQPSGVLLAIRLNTLAEVEPICGESARAVELEERAIGMVPSDTGESRLQGALPVLKDNLAR